MLCETYSVRSIYAFGSSIKTSFDLNSSDIDLVVDIDENDPVKRGNNLLEFWTKLEEFFHKKVDLLTPSSIKNPVLKSIIDQSKVLIYERVEVSNELQKILNEDKDLLKKLGQ